MLKTFVIRFSVIYVAVLGAWMVLLPGYLSAVAWVAEALLPVLEHPRITTSLARVGSGIEVTSLPLKSEGPIYTITAHNVFGSLPAVVSLLLAMPQFAKCRGRALSRGILYMFLGHLIFLQVQLYHLYAAELVDTRGLFFSSGFRHAVGYARTFLFAVGPEAVFGLAAIAGLVAWRVSPHTNRVSDTVPRQAGLAWVPKDVLATGLCFLLLLAGARSADNSTEKLFSRMSSRMNATSTALFRAGQEFSISGQNEEAEKAFKESLARDPGYYPAEIELANQALSEKNWGKAAKHLHSVVRSRPGHVPSLANLGAVKIKLGEAAQAEAYLRRAIELDPGLIEARLNLARLLRATGHVASARLVLREAPREARALLLLAEMNQKEGQYCAANATLSEAETLSPDLATIAEIQRLRTSLAGSCDPD